MSNTWNNQLDQLKKSAITPLAIAIIFIIATAFAIWQLVSSFHLPPAKAGAPLVKAPTPAPRVADLHIMGIYDTKAADIPITQLQLTLQGTVVISDDPTQSRALIQSPGQPTKVYKEGDTIPGNAQIEKINDRLVILNDNGALQKLRMPLTTLPNIQLPRSAD